MLIAGIVLIVLGIGCLVLASTDSSYGWLISGIAASVIGLLMMLFLIKWQVSSNDLSGYAYQRIERFGYSHYSLRFSQNAGADEQLTFCVKAGSDTDKQLRKITGSDTKVKIYVPAGFRLVNDPFECTSYAELKES